MAVLAGILSKEPWWFDAVIAGCLTVVYAVYRLTGGDRQSEEARDLRDQRRERDSKRRGGT